MNSKYETYLEGDWWKARRKKFINFRIRTKRYGCDVCGTRKHIDVHHLSYDHLNAESDSELALLCRDCHIIAHELIRQHKAYLDNSVAILREKPIGTIQKPALGGTEYTVRIINRKKKSRDGNRLATDKQRRAINKYKKKFALDYNHPLEKFLRRNRGTITIVQADEIISCLHGHRRDKPVKIPAWMLTDSTDHTQATQ